MTHQNEVEPAPSAEPNNSANFAAASPTTELQQHPARPPRSATMESALDSITLENVPSYVGPHDLTSASSGNNKANSFETKQSTHGVPQGSQSYHEQSFFSAPQHKQDSDRASLLPRPTEHRPHGSGGADKTRGGPGQDGAPDPHDIVLLSSHESSHAPSYSDLFFDLLFAACLNTYSNAVSLGQFSNVAAFLGYFTALWWAWWSQAYFDVRYRRPSHNQPISFKSCQRVIRAAVLGLWVAFSTTPSEFARGSFTNFTMIYGCSRMALALDHTVVLFYELVHGPSRKYLSAAKSSHNLNHGEESSQLPSHFHIARRVAGKDGMAVNVRTHIVSIASLIISGLLWILSRRLRHNGVTAPLLVMWILAVLVEVSAQLLNELSGVLSPLGSSVLPERLVLFGLIILGEGFTGIAETLNKISPGAKLRNAALDGASIESGGWGADTILQATSCVLIVILQFGGYFHRATNQLNMASVYIVLWAYIHVVLHMSSALLVIGLKKILSFQNTLNALSRFFDNYDLYVPDTPQWQNLTSEQVAGPFNDGDGTSPLSTDGVLAGVSAIISVIQSNDGANVPTLDAAERLVASVVGLAGGSDAAQKLVAQANQSDSSNALSSQFAPSLVLPFKTYFEFADNVVNPDSIDQYVDKSLFQYKYIYVASAVYLTVDIVIKTMQDPRARKLRSFRWAMALRFAFAVVLVLLQVVFTVYQGAPSTAALDGALAICAAVLLAELISQQLVDALQTRLDLPRTPRQRFQPRLPRFGKSSRTQPRSSRSPSPPDKQVAENIEMVS